MSEELLTEKENVFKWRMFHLGTGEFICLLEELPIAFFGAMEHINEKIKNNEVGWITTGNILFVKIK